MNWAEFKAVLFDLDGVLTPTADIHMRAWERMFNEFLALRDPDARPYSPDDYFAHVDGKPRLDGVRSFLQSRDITIAEGGPEDSAAAETVAGLGNRKNEFFSRALADGVNGYRGSIELLDYLARTGLVLGVVSSSRNAPAVLNAAGLRNRFSFVVDGALAAREGLAGKPAPDTYLHGAALAGVQPAEAVVIEDAISGVQAGAAGKFAMVIGVDRGVGAQQLRANGAHLVVNDLKELIGG